MLDEHPKTRQLITLLSSVSISLSAGTNYAFSIYSVQLGHKLHLSATSLNVIGLAGNLGMYISSPFVGRYIDRYGPTIPLLGAGTLISLGYGLLWLLFTQPSLPLVVVQTLMGNLFAGLGSSIANSCAITGTASVFAPSHRATAIGTVLAGFGLSAFFWTTIGYHIAKSDTAVLLALLSIGPSLAILFGASGYVLMGIGCDDRQTSPSSQDQPCTSHSRQSTEDTQLLPLKKQTDITGWALVRELDFWMIWLVMSCCCGIGLMIINNLGTMLVAIYGPTSPDSSDQTVRLYQAHAVSILSIFNCFGRIFAGTFSDLLKRGLSIGRVWWLCWISSLFLLSQILGYFAVSELDHVVWLGGLVGFAYGNMYGAGPALVLEWFGLKHFATNFGFLNLAPLLCGQIFNLSFGRIFDHHSQHSSDAEDRHLVCLDRRGCYQAAFLITICGALLSLSLSISLGFRRPEFISQSKSNSNFRRTHEHDGDDDGESAPILRSSTEDL
ncbi:hypothetical protein PGT21_035618 [Puccinia graminis f. sp. tritici]|uniref:Nodulin-like domain-containing protein n=1 Tax=Puccinia graminis f. sp. tritici TaxID=56615 RepID=A0A5B0N6C4_PUCGR|nr:hypothetical protein PGTUg99_027158 [Puccinia graminis f. sp. tritici]KAA1084807.1 hypothetical protein PGT21_035618 [Puccinia graminis f. sp. tritici]